MPPVPWDFMALALGQPMESYGTEGDVAICCVGFHQYQRSRAAPCRITAL